MVDGRNRDGGMFPEIFHRRYLGIGFKAWHEPPCDARNDFPFISKGDEVTLREYEYPTGERGINNMPYGKYLYQRTLVSGETGLSTPN